MDTRKFYLPIFISLFLILSCSKDEPNTTFEGTWLLQAIEKRNCTDESKNSSKDGLFIFYTPCNIENRFLCRYEKYTFDKTTYIKDLSSTLFAIPLSGSEEGSYTIEGSTLTICKERSSGATECTVFQYSINGDSMSFALTNPENGCLEIDYYLKQ